MVGGSGGFFRKKKKKRLGVIGKVPSGRKMKKV